jgi:hypothetical protein
MSYLCLLYGTLVMDLCATVAPQLAVGLVAAGDDVLAVHGESSSDFF